MTDQSFDTATRAEGLRRIAAFQASMGGHYRGARNHDFGPMRRDNVSVLSPYLRRRLVLEAEVVKAALDQFKYGTAEKFIQEVIWRTYFKGWLEQRPQVWQSYRQGLEEDLQMLSDQPDEAARVAAAEAGETGIAPFDAWAKELVQTGYLHNHARMWFASIWIFTLRLPWRLGADFFLRHLLDGDPASNTCSWRWVGGLHTVGRTYLARASNIAKFTDGRFAGVDGLAKAAPPLDEGGLPPLQDLRGVSAPDPKAPSVRLITEEDLCAETLPPVETLGTATLHLSALRSPRAVSDGVATFDRAALADAATRAGGADSIFEDPTPQDLAAWATSLGARQIVTAYLPTGWVQDWMEAARPTLDAAGLTLVEQQRDWDKAFWPHAKAGFFAVKKKIPETLATLGVQGDPAPLPLFEALQDQ